MTVSLALLALAKSMFPSSFSSFIILPFNDKYVKLTKDKGKIRSGFHVLLTLFQLLNFSLFCFLSNNILNGHQIDFYPLVFWIMFAGLLFFVLVKIVLQFGNGYFFQNQSLMTNLIFEKLSYFNYSGLIAFFGNIILTYIFIQSVPTIYIIFLLIAMVNLIGIVNTLRNRQKLILSNLIYFILYLCALEISPLVILISFLKD
ncbi:Hypothetical protein I595_1223 [Croceitalea dokdonensis DOKDO 023]|uniref:DUF4271 domain-containing protein n=2 Tax=Croceitalea TaxID=574891 RepID=A0A0N8H4A1_9FLAO|nr:Hypothetical protein I595_1223 [Croceitalea dokdonensis DOKDO 023]